MTAAGKLSQDGSMPAARRPAPLDDDIEDVSEHQDGWEEEIDRRITDAHAGRGGPALTLEELDAQTRAMFGWPG